MDVALKRKINLLIQLALVDGNIDIRERAFIYNVCIRNGVDLDTIGDMIDHQEPIANLAELSFSSRVDYITDCLMLTLVDGIVLPKETDFVMSIASQLGFAHESMDILISEIGDDMEITRDELHSRVMNVASSITTPRS